jgi:hypothetical protein
LKTTSSNSVDKVLALERALAVERDKVAKAEAALAESEAAAAELRETVQLRDAELLSMREDVVAARQALIGCGCSTLVEDGAASPGCVAQLAVAAAATIEKQQECVSAPQVARVAKAFITAGGKLWRLQEAQRVLQQSRVPAKPSNSARDGHKPLYSLKSAGPKSGKDTASLLLQEMSQLLRELDGHAVEPARSIGSPSPGRAKGSPSS